MAIRMRLRPTIEPYRVVSVDDEVCLRLIGPDGRQHRLLSLALTALLGEGRHAPRTALRYIAAFRKFLNDVEAKHPSAADAFVSSVLDCRRTVDRYLVAMSVRSGDIGGGARFARPPGGVHRKVADAIVAVGKVTRLLTDVVYGGQDPSKVDRRVSRTNGVRLTTVNRHGLIRVDVDRRIRIGTDPTAAPRLDDPHVYDRWCEGLGVTDAGAPFHRILGVLRHAGPRCFQALGLTLHDVFCLGGGRYLPVPKKGDLGRQRTLRKQLPPDELQRLFTYIDGDRARVSGMTLRDIRVIACDPRRWGELQDLPLFTENGVDPITYDRLRSVTRKAAIVMDLVLGDEIDECQSDEVGAVSNVHQPRYVTLHMLRHEYVHERLAAISVLDPTAQASARRQLVRYMGWSGDGMLRWYSAHYRIIEDAYSLADHNQALNSALQGNTIRLSSDEFDDAVDRAMPELA